MSDGTVTCPKCQHSFELTTAMASEIELRLRTKYEGMVARDRAAIEARERDAAAKLLQAEKARADSEAEVTRRVAADKVAMEQQLAAQLSRAKTELVAKARKEAEEGAAAEVLALKEENERAKAKLAQSQAAELALRKQREELESAKREFELEKQRAIDAAKAEMFARATRDVEEQFRLKLAEKDKLLADSQAQASEMKRRLEQGSQQTQGEVLELDFEAQLRQAFPMDSIEPVAKGVGGGDALQRVFTSNGKCVGSILWELKRTKTWSDGWLAKLRADGRAAKADACALMSVQLPKGVQTFDVVEDVWVCGVSSAMPLARVLRHGLMQAAMARAASEGQQTKQQMVYSYLTGPGFRQRVEAIQEAFVTMQEDLNVEKKALTKQWAKREKQIEMVIDATMGMYGDLQGIAGKSMPEIEGMDVKLLGEAED